MPSPTKRTKQHEQIPVPNRPLRVGLLETQQPQTDRSEHDSAPCLKIRTLPDQQAECRHDDNIESGDKTRLPRSSSFVSYSRLLQKRAQEQENTRTQTRLNPILRAKSIQRLSLVPDEKYRRQANRTQRVTGTVKRIRTKVFSS